jgi:hypothetical protein
LDNIETVAISSLAGNVAVDTANFSGVQTYVSNGIGGLSLLNVDGVGATLIKEGNSSALTVSYDATTVGGIDSQHIELVGSTGGLITLDGNGATIENVYVTSESGDTSAAQLAVAGQTLVINGGGTVTLGSTANKLNSSFTTIDARDTAKVVLNAEGTNDAATYLTGDGDDRLTLSSNIGDVANNLISMGDGEDTLNLLNSITAVLGETPATLVGVENVNFLAAGNSLDLSNSAGAIAFGLEQGGSLALFNAQSGLSVSSDTAGVVGDLTVQYRESVFNEELVVDHARAMNGSVEVESLNSLVMNFSSSDDSVVTEIAVDATTNDGTDSTESIAITNIGSGTVEIGGITTMVNSSDITDIVINASRGDIAGAGLDKAQDLSNVTIIADDGAVGIASYGSIESSTKLDQVSLTAVNSSIDDLNDVTEFNASNLDGISSVVLAATGGAIGATNAIDFVNDVGDIAEVSITGSFAVNATFNADNISLITSTNTGSVNLQVFDNAVTGELGSTVVLGDASHGNLNILRTDAGNDLITGGSGVDYISSGAGDDVISVGAGDDEVDAGQGADMITLGVGKDSMIQMLGDGMTATYQDTSNGGLFEASGVTNGDTFVFENGVDVITDFISSDGDSEQIIDKLIFTSVLSEDAGFVSTMNDENMTGDVENNSYALVRGDFDESTGVFVLNLNGGADQAIFYDGDITDSVSTEAIIVLGIGGDELTAGQDLIVG